MHIIFTLSHRTPLPASVIATFLLPIIIADLQLAQKGTTYWPKYTIKCVGVSIRLPYAMETVNLAKLLGNNNCIKFYQKSLTGLATFILSYSMRTAWKFEFPI